MAVTVTATSSGAGSLNGILLAVRVLVNGSRTQNGATASSITALTPQLAITPGTSGSWVYGAALYGGGGTTFTSIDANTTSVANTVVVAGQNYSVYRSTAGTTTSSTTYGWTLPTGSSGTFYIAEAEVKGTGTISEDASTPAVASTASALTVTTASFTPPAAAVLVAAVNANCTGTTGVVIAMTDSASAYVWTQRSTTAGAGSLASVWVGIPVLGTTVPPPPPVPELFQPPGALSAGRFTPWPPWQDTRPPVPVNATVIVSSSGSTGGAVPGRMIPGAAVPGSEPAGATAVIAKAAFPAPLVTATARPPLMPPASNCAWVRSAYY